MSSESETGVSGQYEYPGSLFINSLPDDGHDGRLSHVSRTAARISRARSRSPGHSPGREWDCAWPSYWDMSPTTCSLTPTRWRRERPVRRPEPKSDAEPTASRSTVSLSEAKLKEAKIAIEPARFDRIATGVAVVGVIQANSDRQVEVRPRAAGIVREVHVVLEQKVKRGDPLVTLDSPEIGTARLNLRARQRELSTARFEAAWRSEIAANVALLIPDLRKGINQRRAELADDEEHADTHAPRAQQTARRRLPPMRSTPGSSRSALPISS